jgi:predicted Zn-dependent peptidase
VPFHRHVLPNGLNLIGESSPSARSTALGFFVRTGSRDETPEVSGVSHFLEHMVFKGTPRRSAFDVNRDFDAIGADYNAFTSEENTVFYGAVLPEYLPQLSDILADILRPSLRLEDFTVEKNVIIEEIGMYEDQPTWCCYDHAKKSFFADHPLGNSVLGSNESITALSRDQMQEYFDRRYVANNITVAVAGNFVWDDFVALIEKQCGAWPQGDAPRLDLRPAQPNPLRHVLTKEKILQEHCFLLAPGPASNSPLRYAAHILAMILGDDSNSRLYWELVDPGRAESADVSFHDYDGTGVFFTSLSCDPDNTAKDLEIIENVFKKVRKEGVTEAELATAKSKLLSREVRAGERPKGRMQALGMTWLYLNQYRSVDDELHAVEAVDMAQIRDVIDQFDLEKQAVTALGPLTKL